MSSKSKKKKASLKKRLAKLETQMAGVARWLADVDDRVTYLVDDQREEPVEMGGIWAAPDPAGRYSRVPGDGATLAREYAEAFRKLRVSRIALHDHDRIHR